MLPGMHVCMYAGRYVRTCVYSVVRMCMYVCAYVCTYVKYDGMSVCTENTG